jgi:hypothetical protein
MKRAVSHRCVKRLSGWLARRAASFPTLERSEERPLRFELDALEFRDKRYVVEKRGLDQWINVAFRCSDDED